MGRSIIRGAIISSLSDIPKYLLQTLTSMIMLSGSYLMSPASASDTELSIAQFDWCPQICPGEEKPGYIVDIVTEAFQTSPYKLTFLESPWSRAILRVRSGDIDALLAPAKKEAPYLAYPQQPVGVQRMCFFVNNKSDWHYTGEASLKGRNFGLINNTSVEGLDAYIEANKNQFQFMADNKNVLPRSLKMLSLGRFDIFIFTHDATVFALAKLGLDHYIKSAGCASSAPIYMAFTPTEEKQEKIQAAMKHYNRSITKMTENGRISAIMASYGLPDWTQLH